MMPITVFSRAWELSSMLYLVASVCGVFGAIFLWLAIYEYYRAKKTPRRLLLHRRAFDFDLYRGFSFASVAWCLLMVVMALEPRLWIARVEAHQLVFVGWIVICLGLMLGLGMFAVGRVQEILGLHRFQRMASDDIQQHAAMARS